LINTNLTIKKKLKNIKPPKKTLKITSWARATMPKSIYCLEGWAQVVCWGPRAQSWKPKLKLERPARRDMLVLGMLSHLTPLVLARVLAPTWTRVTIPKPNMLGFKQRTWTHLLPLRHSARAQHFLENFLRISRESHSTLYQSNKYYLEYNTIQNITRLK
jgi:hypothetical protein